MKQEASKKNKKWLWITLGVVAVLAVVGVVLALVLGGGNTGNTDGPKGGRPELYWNVARQSYLDPETGLSNREAAGDGLYYITFAINGEQVEYPVADKKTVNYIDSMEIMGLVFDNDGMVIDAIDPLEIATEFGKSLYVQSVSGNLLVANSSIVMNGMRFNINITDKTEIYEVSGAGEFEGVKVEASALMAMDTITVYANDKDEITHIYVIDHPDESKVYWRANQVWNSKEKCTAREPDANGDYTLDFYCEGELVYFKTKNVAIASKIDGTSRFSAHFGLRFDEDGYVVEILNSAIASRTTLACERFDITEFDGETFTATRLLTNDGSSYTGMVTADTRIYNASAAARAEDSMGQPVESIQLGDRVCVWTDPNGDVVLIYVSNRIVDSPAYYLPSRKYNSTLGETTLEPNAKGVYEVELLREGDNKLTVYKTTDKAIMTAVHKSSDKCVGLKVDENNNIIYVYDTESLFGNTYFCRGRYISESAGIVASFMLPSDLSVKNGVLASGCKIYNVSKIGQYGAETEFQVGDYVYAFKQASGEVVHAYVIRRYIGENTQYYNLESLYNKETMTSTREAAADGWYYFNMANGGKTVVLKTKDKAIVDAVDTLGAVVPIAALQLSGDVITGVLDPTYSTGGAKVASGYRIKSISSDGTVTAYYKEKEVSFTLADDALIYNVSELVNSHKGEKGSLKIGDMITAFTNCEGKATIVWVRGRQVENMYWKLDRFYDSTNEVTKREPDADGWYWYDLAVNGECKKFKTKDINIANSMDRYEAAFGLQVSGDEITGFVGVGNVKDCSGSGLNNWMVTAVAGNKITLTYTYTGEDLGKAQTITLTSDAKIYDVSGTDAKTFGAKTTLKVGDIVRTYLDKNGENHQYVYIKARSNREYISYCDHCDEFVYWNPYIKDSSVSGNNHYYLTADVQNRSQITYGSTTKDYDVVLDLAGHSLTRNGGRAILVRYGDTMSIIDSVGGGTITGSAHAANGGAIMVTDATLNLHGGTVQLTSDEKIMPQYGGCVYVTGEESVFNMYGGTIQNGRSYIKSEKYGGYGGNLYVTGGTFNMTGGTIAGGKAISGVWETTEADGTVTKKSVRSNGGNVYFSSSVTANITGGTITGGYTDGYGGNIYTSTDGNVVNISNTSITNGHAFRGGNIYGTGTITLSGVTMSGGIADQRGGNIVATNGTWLLKGGTKVLGGVAGDNSTSGYGGNMMVNDGSFTIADATVDGGEVKREGTGGNIYCLYGGTLTINEGAVISNGTSYGAGGNIYVAGPQESATTANVYDRRFTLVINGGKIVGGTSTSGNGGNIAVSGYSADVDGDGTKEYVGGSNFYMYGGEISGGTCAESKYGGNLYLQVDEAVISGGKIFGGKQGEAEYDVYVPGEAKNVTISGGQVAGKFRINALDAVTISGNPVLGQLNLAKNAMITVGQMTDGADIAVIVTATTTGGVFTKAFTNAEAYKEAEYFTAYEEGKVVDVNADSQLCVEAEQIVDPNAYTAYCEHCEQNVQWSVWQYFTDSGHYYLKDIHTLINTPAIIASGTDVVIDLKGLSITGQDNLAFDVLGTLSIVDTVGGGQINGTGPSNGVSVGGVVRIDGGTLNLYSGVLKMSDTHYNTAGGGVMFLRNNATFNMFGGELAGGQSFGDPNSSNTNTQKGRGGNIYNTASVVNLIGGKIYGGDAGIGGNIYNGTNGVINFAGTEIYGGEANYNGGNIFSESGELNFIGSSITNGTAVNIGSNIYLYSANLEVNLVGGTIDGEIYARGVASITASGAPTVNNLILNSGVLLSLDEITGGSVKVTADGVFTGVLTNAEPYLTYITAAEEGKQVAVTTLGELTVVEESGSDTPVVDPTATPFNDVYTNAVAMTTNGVFDNASAVTAPCPYCSANGDTSDKQWSALGAVGELSGGHYFVAEEITGNTNYYTISGDVCLHLNGNNITSTARVFHVGSSGTLNVMGDGTVTGGYKNSSNAHYAATLDSVGCVNLCGGTWKRANNAPVIDGRGSSVEGVINVYNGTTIQGDSDYTGYALVALLNKTQMNIYGGTITGGTWTGGTGGNIYVMANSYADRVTELNIYGGTISNGSAASGGNVYVKGGASRTNAMISGGTITGGSVYVENAVASMTITGTPVIENLELAAGTVINLGVLSGDASIAVTANGEFTGVLENASDYLTYIKAYEEGKTVSVTSGNTLAVELIGGGNDEEEGEEEEEQGPTATPYNSVYTNAVAMTTNGVFDNATTVTAPCPYCSAGGDTSDKQWTALTAVTGSSVTLEDGHYFLADSMTGNTGYYNVTGTACVHLNGKNVTTTSGKLAFYATSSGVLNVMGAGEITGSRRHSSNAFWASTLDSVGIVNLCGGTWKRANNSPVVDSRGTGVCQLNIYNGTTIQGDSDYTDYALVTVVGNTDLRMYGGTITGGSWTSGNGGNIRVFNSNNANRVASVTIYGGVISNGSAALGGNIYVEGGSSGYTNLELAGGTITGGSVYVKRNGSTLTVSGNAQVENLDLADGALVNLGVLTETASIKLNGIGALTVENTNAQAYVDAGYIVAYEGKNIRVDGNVIIGE